MHIPSTGLLRAAGMAVVEHDLGRACYSCAPDGCTLLTTAREIVTEYLSVIAATRPHVTAAAPIHPLPGGSRWSNAGRVAHCRPHAPYPTAARPPRTARLCPSRPGSDRR